MRKRIGEFLIEKGALSEAQVNEILEHGRKSGLRFGEAGIDLGLLNQEKLIAVFGPSFSVDFFHVEAQYFPKITQDLLPIDVMLRLGALPLGFKTEKRLFRTRKVLNLGLLDPARSTEVTAEVVRLALAKLGGKAVHDVKVFLILTDQFLNVLESVYGLNMATLHKTALKDLDGTLAMYLENIT